VSQSPRGGQCLAQIVPAQGTIWYDNRLLKPQTLFGDADWSDCVIEADVLLAGGDVEIGGRYADRNKLGYRWVLARDGHWQLNWQTTSLASGQIPGFKPEDWHHLRLELNGTKITGSVDGVDLASVNDASKAKGMAFLASTYDRNLFDQVRVTKTRSGKSPE
jgi:galactosylceramidase